MTATALATEFRPHTFSDVVGQAPVRVVLRAMVREQRVPPALLFTGARGTGKTTTARIFAAALNCEEPSEGDACGACLPCRSVQLTDNSVVLEIDAASHGGIDEVRAIREALQYEATVPWRVIMLDEAHSMSRPAFNALLKVLEEPPDHTVFILLTTEPGRIPDTVVSRSMVFDFRRMTVEAIVGRLMQVCEAKSFTVEPEVLREIAVRAEGGMRDALMALDRCMYVGVTTVEAYREMFGLIDIAVPVFTAALQQDFAGGARLIDDYFFRVGDARGLVSDLVDLVRDLLVLHSGASLEVPSEVREKLALQVSLVQLVDVVRVLWELKSRTRTVDSDHRSQLEMAFVLIVDALAAARGPIHQEETAVAPETALALGDIAAIAASYTQRRTASGEG